MYAFIYILWYIHMWLCVYHLRTENYVQENIYYAQRNMAREELAKKKKSFSGTIQQNQWIYKMKGNKEDWGNPINLNGSCFILVFQKGDLLLNDIQTEFRNPPPTMPFILPCKHIFVREWVFPPHTELYIQVLHCLLGPAKLCIKGVLLFLSKVFSKGYCPRHILLRMHSHCTHRWSTESHCWNLQIMFLLLT